MYIEVWFFGHCKLTDFAFSALTMLNGYEMRNSIWPAIQQKSALAIPHFPREIGREPVLIHGKHRKLGQVKKSFVS